LVFITQMYRDTWSTKHKKKVRKCTLSVTIISETIRQQRCAIGTKSLLYFGLQHVLASNLRTIYNRDVRKNACRTCTMLHYCMALTKTGKNPPNPQKNESPQY